MLVFHAFVTRLPTRFRPCLSLTCLLCLFPDPACPWTILPCLLSDPACTYVDRLACSLTLCPALTHLLPAVLWFVGLHIIRLILFCWYSSALVVLPIKYITNTPGFLECCIWVLRKIVTERSGQNMDPAHSSTPRDRFERVEDALQRQEASIASLATEAHHANSTHDQTLTYLAAQLQQLTATVQQLAAAVVAAPAPLPMPPAPASAFSPMGFSPEPRVGTPERYAGEPEGCSPFLTNCSILFALQPHTFASEAARVAFTVNHLTGKARLWGTAEWERQTPACSSFPAFSAELRKVFGPVSVGPDAAGGLLSLSQGNGSVVDYAIGFRTRGRLSNWNSEAQCDAYLRGLAAYIKDELVSFDLPNSLDGLIELTSRMDRRIQTRRRERRSEGVQHAWAPRHPGPTGTPPLTPEPHPAGDEPMQVGRTSLTLEEREHRRRGNLCLYCGRAGHFVSRCPVKGKAQQ